VHRLDKDTSGIVVFAKNENMHRHLSQQFEHRETKKIYTGLVLGNTSEPSGIIDEPIGEHPTKKGVMTVLKKGKESTTEWEEMERFRFFSWMQFKILTGRTHQIRVHMKYIGHPIVCDPVYGDGKPVLLSQLKNKYNLSKKEEEEKPLLKRLALHAAELSFTGLKGESYKLEAPLPKDLKAMLNQMQKLRKQSL
jgi:23S rRNA pseudouridine955/2504/2580 synthase/23S rRNA pseudouridine1911/1915/1917 synthase